LGRVDSAPLQVLTELFLRRDGVVVDDVEDLGLPPSLHTYPVEMPLYSDCISLFQAI
jgi:hypothetical protein